MRWPSGTCARCCRGLHLNLGEDYRKLGDFEAARRHLESARERLDALGDDDYAAAIRAALDGLAERLS